MSEESPKTRKKMRWARWLPVNVISLGGVALALVGLANIIIFFLVDLVSERPKPYIGILAYMISPAFLVTGLLIAGIGMWLERRRRATERPAEYPLYPRIDLNDPRMRRAVLSFGTFLLVFILLSSMGSYKAYEFTDSVQFCGQVCHTVMNPEFTAYQLSPHARVSCVECHVGSGATWYVKSKLSGARQVYAVAFNKFPRPIPTPVHNLRPAQETCEQCHWPRKFYGAQLKVFTHFASDEKNTPRQIRMLIKTGGGDPATGAPEGIHWHMNINNEITYVAADEQRQSIPYVHVKDMQGRVTEYYAKDASLSKEQIAASPKHRMDCIDCHNRPSHIYVPPDRAVDESLLARRIDSSLPYIKQQAVTALSAPYNTTEQAMQGVAETIERFYETKYPGVTRSKQLEIRNAVQEVQQLYRHTTFPEMKVNWQTHPNNLGHFYFSGCFRCHDGQHVSADGKVISKDCNICHTVLSQEEGGVSIAAPAKVSFQHPIDLGDISAVNCSDCHTGGVGP